MDVTDRSRSDLTLKAMPVRRASLPDDVQRQRMPTEGRSDARRPAPVAAGRGVRARRWPRRCATATWSSSGTGRGCVRATSSWPASAALPDRLVVKRAVRPADGGWWLRSDNAFAGGDSDAHGAADVLGRVVVRVSPGTPTASMRRGRPWETRGRGRTPQHLTPCAVTSTAQRQNGHRSDQEMAVGFDADSAVFRVHEGGKLSVRSTLPLVDRESLSLAYTPGVAEVCTAIAADEALARTYTWRSRLVAVVSDGTAVLGLGNIGPAAALPVMEGKAALFSEFAGLNAVPIVLDTTDPDEIVATVERIAPSFGGINLEDISAPRCFDIEARLRDRARHPGVPRRPARHGDRRARRAAQRRRGHRPHAGRTAGRRVRRRRGRRGLHQDPARGRHRRHRRGRLEGRPAPGPVRPHRGQGRAGRRDEPRRSHRVAGRRAGRRRRLPRAQRRARSTRTRCARWRRRRSSSRWPTRIPRSIPRSRTATPRSSRPAAATTRTRSTTCWPSPACSRARSTPARGRSPRT